jgi:hypothetical protein
MSKKSTEEIDEKLTGILARRKGPREKKETVVEKASKYTVEFRETSKDKISSIWHYDLKKNPHGPVYVQNFE